LRLDDAEANLCEALHCGDPRRRDAVSMFMPRNTQRASKRGYAVSASAASLEVGFDNRTPAQTVVFKWAGDDREMDLIECDGKKISVPRYGGGRGDDCLEGEVATPAVLIEHAAPVASEPRPVASSPLEALSVVQEPSPPPSVTSAIGSTLGSGTASSTTHSPPVSVVVSRSLRGRIGSRFRTARRERAFIGPVTPNGGLTEKRRRDRR
jgi:hypothetical protein